jgi:hypothetical protein
MCTVGPKDADAGANANEDEGADIGRLFIAVSEVLLRSKYVDARVGVL